MSISTGIMIRALHCAEPELLKGILTVVSALNVTVIWKLTSKDQAVLSKAGAILPPHVHAVKFAPQNDLLGHGAVRAFITQGGSNSLYEVIPDFCMSGCPNF